MDIVEFKEAIAYVTEASKGAVSFGDSRSIDKLFKAMDADGNGAVDFDEFMAVTCVLFHMISIDEYIHNTGYDWTT